jgi:hypothetical protein
MPAATRLRTQRARAGGVVKAHTEESSAQPLVARRSQIVLWLKTGNVMFLTLPFQLGLSESPVDPSRWDLSTLGSLLARLRRETSAH